MKISFSGYDDTLAQSYQHVMMRWFVCFAAYLAVVIGVFLVFRDGGAVFIAILAVPALVFLPPLRRRINVLSCLRPVMEQWARQNKWRYVPFAKPNYQKHFQPATAQLGSFERHEHVVKGKYGTYNFETYVDTYRNMFSYRFDRVKIRVITLKLPKEFPHIYMINRQSGNRALSLVPRHFDDAQRLNLEGDFNEYFTVYTHRNTRTQALSLLAPNVMQTLMKTDRKFDLEFLGGYLYLYTRDIVPSKDDWKATFAALDAFLGHLEHRLKSWKFVLPNNRKFPYMTSRAGFGTLTIGGKYYNAAWGFIIFSTVYSLFKVFLNQNMWMLKLTVIIASNIAMIAALLVQRRKYQLSRRNKAL